jgi:hypothetical protein
MQRSISSRAIVGAHLALTQLLNALSLLTAEEAQQIEDAGEYQGTGGSTGGRDKK